MDELLVNLLDNLVIKIIGLQVTKKKRANTYYSPIIDHTFIMTITNVINHVTMCFLFVHTAQMYFSVLRLEVQDQGAYRDMRPEGSGLSWPPSPVVFPPRALFPESKSPLFTKTPLRLDAAPP